MMVHPQAERNTPRTLARVEERERSPRLEKLTKEEFIAFLRQEAHERGLFLRGVSHLIGNRRWGDRKNLVNINGYLCRLYQPASTKFHAGITQVPHTRPGFLRTALEEADFAVVYQEAALLPPNLFIVPSVVLLQKFRAGEPSHRFYIPHEPLSRNTVFWFKYKDAWHLLAKASSETSATG